MTFDGLCVLLLEDEPIIGLQLEEMIERAGARTIYTATIEQAHRALQLQEPDAAVLDVNVHGRNSYPIAMELKEAGIPFIFATGYSTSLHPDELASTPTVGKPYNMRDICRALEEAGAHPRES